MVATAIFLNCSLSFSLPAFFSFDWSCACATARQVGFGDEPQSVRHVPPRSSAGGVQVRHWFAPGPLHVRHDGSHPPQVVSVVAVQTALSNVPVLHVVHASHVVWPVVSWKVPVEHAGHALAPVAAVAVPGPHARHEVAPVVLWNAPGLQLSHEV